MIPDDVADALAAKRHITRQEARQIVTDVIEAMVTARQARTPGKRHGHLSAVPTH